MYSIYFSDRNNGFATGFQNVYKTTNGGDDWSVRSVSSSFLYSVYFLNENTGYVTGEGGKIYKTTNNGLIWTNQLFGTTTTFRSVYFVNSNTGYCSGDLGKILKTTNGGSSWIEQASITNNNLYSLYFTNSNTGYTVGDLGTILKTIDGGSIISVNQISNTVPDKFSLSQNYPNPFNPKTTINYELPRNEFVKIKLYDIMGRELFTLVNELKQAGSYKLNFDGQNLASGIYFYKIEAGSFIKTKRMVLSK